MDDIFKEIYEFIKNGTSFSLTFQEWTSVARKRYMDINGHREIEKRIEIPTLECTVALNYGTYTHIQSRRFLAMCHLELQPERCVLMIVWVRSGSDLWHIYTYPGTQILGDASSKTLVGKVF